MPKKRIASASPWEDKFSYSRAVRVGNHVYVAGTSGTDAEGHAVGRGAHDQASHALERVHAALSDAGASLRDVVRLRTYLTNIDDWPEVARAYMERFAKVRPALTVVEVSRLYTADMLVEIECDAVIEPRTDDVFI